MTYEIIKNIREDRLTITLSSDHKIDVTGDRSKVDYWLPVIAQHRNQIVQQLKIDAEIEVIRNWLYRIGEPEVDHRLVIDKCKTDPEALIYFLRHANGEYESGYSVTTEADVDDDRVRCSQNLCKILHKLRA